MAGKFVDVTLRLIDKMTGPLNNAGNALANHAKQFNRAGRDIQRAGRSISKVGASLTKSVTAPIVGAGAAAVKLAAGFEKGMDKVQSISGKVSNKALVDVSNTAEKMGLSFQKGSTNAETAMNILGAKAKEMGAKTKFSATEASEAYSYMAMAGWKAGDMLNGIEPIMKLAGASGESLASTSDILTDALTAFGKSAADTGEFADVLVAASSNANTNVAMLGESFKYAAPVAGALGYSVQDVSAALGLMANSGIKASSAGTSLRSWMSRMSKPTDEVAVAMKTLGISLTDSNGNMKDFGTVMTETRSAFDGLSKSQKAQYASSLAGKTGMSGLLAIVNSSDKDFKKLTEAINGSSGACNKMYDVANDNLNGQLTILKSTVESIGISFGEKLTPYVKKTVELIQNAANKFNSLSDAQQNTIIKIGLIAAAVGPALFVFGSMISKVGGVIKTFGKLGMVFKRFGSISAIIASPAGIVIGVMAALAVAAFVVIKNWDKIKPVIDKVVKSIQPAISTFKGMASTISKAFAPVAKIFKRDFGNAISESFGMVSKEVGGSKGVIQSFANFVNSAAKVIAPVIISCVNACVPILKKIIPVVAQAIPKAVKIAINIVKVIANVIKAAIPIVKACIPPIKNAAIAIGTILVKAVNGAIPIIKKVANVAKLIFSELNKLTPIIKDALGKAFEFAIPIIKTVIDTTKSVVSVLSKNFVKCINSLKPVINSLKNLFGVVAKNFIKCINSTKPVLVSFGKLFGIIFKKACSSIKNFWNFIKPVALGIVKTVMSIAQILQPAFQKAVEIAGSIIKGFSNTIATIFSGIMGVINGCLTFITGVFTGDWKKAWSGVKSIFSNIFSTFAELAKKPINGVISIINKAIKALNNIKVSIPDWVPELGGKSFGIQIPLIPALAKGTDNWKGGIVQVHEKGGEIIDLPKGSRVYPHDESVKKAYKDGERSRDRFVRKEQPKDIKPVTGHTKVEINIPKLADQIIVREDADIDKIVKKLADRLEKVSLNVGGGEIGYLY